MLKLFDEIAKVGSPDEKIQMLKAYPYQEELKTTLKLALDPFITFGVTDFPQGEGGEEDPWTILRQLANRELTGGAAKAALAGSVDPEDRELFLRILRKDLRCGVGEKLVLRLYPDLLRQFEVMRAKEYQGFSPRTHYRIEPKMDGLRCIAVLEKGKAKLFSRNGKEFTSSNHVIEQLEFIMRGQGDGVFDGELIGGNFNESVSAVKKKGVQNTVTNYHVFDFLTPEEWRNPITPYLQRRMKLEDLYQSTDNLILVPSHRVETEAEAMKFYSHYLDNGYEGAMLKNIHGLYRFKRHKDWMKLKEQGSVDLTVESLIQGEGKYHGMLGAAVVRYNGKKVNVGTGFSDLERQEYWNNPNLILRKVIEVHFHQETPDGSLRHPRFHQIRLDKSV